MKTTNKIDLSKLEATLIRHPQLMSIQPTRRDVSLYLEQLDEYEKKMSDHKKKLKDVLFKYHKIQTEHINKAELAFEMAYEKTRYQTVYDTEAYFSSLLILIRTE